MDWQSTRTSSLLRLATLASSEESCMLGLGVYSDGIGTLWDGILAQNKNVEALIQVFIPSFAPLDTA